jgi:hypothetical protein
MTDTELTFSEMAKIADKGSCVLLGKAEWEAFTRKLFALDCRVKDLEKKRKYWENKYKELNK